MRYTQIAIATPFEGEPKINLPSCYGASPEKPILLKIPVTGLRPITYQAEHLPEGLKLEDGILRGSVANEGNYEITLIAENELGRAQKKLTLEIKPEGVLLTPLMGYTSWNDTGFGISQETIEQRAQQLLDHGLTEYGYRYVNTDSGWQGQYGGEFDAVMANEKFPDMKGMCQKLHAMGFLCGIYSSPMLRCFGVGPNYVPQPPGTTQGEPDIRFSDEHDGIGRIRKEKNNALQWAQWGFDYLKYDWRPSDPYNAELMRQELIKTDRDFGFCVTVKARPEYHTYWEKHCNSYRCNPDCTGIWSRTMEIYRSYFDFIPHVNRGHYFDLDMLDLGPSRLFHLLHYTDDPEFGYTEDEQLIIYSLRAFFASPIQISCDLAQVDEFLLSVLCNEEVIAINQDCGGYSAKHYMMLEAGEKMIHVWKRKLENGDIAYAAFNLGKTEEKISIYLDEECTVRDVWAKKDLSNTSRISLTMKPHTVRIFRTSAV